MPSCTHGAEYVQLTNHNYQLRNLTCFHKLKQIVRKLEGCKYFVNIGQTLDGTVLYRPSTQDDIRAVEKTLCDFTDKEQINYIPEVTFFDFETSIKKNKSSISPADLEQCENFTLEYGQQWISSHCSPVWPILLPLTLLESPKLFWRRIKALPPAESIGRYRVSCRGL